MKIINNKLIVVEILEKDNLMFDNIESRILSYIKKDFPNSKLIGKLSDISEEDCSRFVFEYTNETNTYDKSGFKNYLYNSSVWSFDKFKDTAKESLISLLQSQGVDTNKNLLLIEKL